MSGSVVRKNDDFFISAAAFIPLFERLTDQHLVIDSLHTMLLLETHRNYKYSVAGIQIEKKINGSLIIIQANTKLGDVESWLKPDGWLFVTIIEAKNSSERGRQPIYLSWRC